MPYITNKNIIDYLKELRVENDALILEMEKYALEHKVPILDWKSAEFIEQLILIKKPQNVLEVGTAIGYTTIRIARLLPEDSVIDTLELSKHNIPVARENFRKANLENRINLIEGNAKENIPVLNKLYDVVFLDADKLDYIEYYEMLIHVLNPGGILIIDNLLWKGFVATDEITEDYKPSTLVVKKLNEIIANDSRVKATILPVGDGLGVCIRQ